MNEFTLSDQQNKPCFGKPCACLDCKHEDWFCCGIDNSTHPCLVCSGDDDERAFEFCIPEDYEFPDYKTN